jgi:hypothetical protein
MSGMSIRQANDRDAAAAAAAANPPKRKLVYIAAVVAILAVALGSYSYFSTPGATKRSKQAKPKSFFEDKPSPMDAPAGSAFFPPP